MPAAPRPDRLPIYEIEPELVRRLREQRRLILQAPTGSGKSTQVPQMLLHHGFLEAGQVVVLQPRRLATRLLAARVARELGGELGQEVGYQIRFENVTSRRTRVRFVTEGVLLRQMIQDPRLEGVAVLIFDEFHERHLYGDITLARAVDLQESVRPDLRLIVMSATLDAGLLEPYLRPCSVVASAGRTFPVDIEFAPWKRTPDSVPVWELAADVFAEHVQRGDAGDVLVFMPGGYEIHQTIEAIRHRPESRGFILLPLHGELPPNDQDAAVARYEQPKVVVATNVAETSLTIDGVRLVIDSGLARIPRYDPNRGINTLLVEKISQASADQRAGRAGRTAPGRCVRLWPQSEHGLRPANETPEVRRLDLCEVVLALKAAGIADLSRFRWLEPPSDAALAHAEELLLDLGALVTPARVPEPAATVGEGPAPAERAVPGAESAGLPSGTTAGFTRITALGRKMLAFPAHPRYARMLLAAAEYGCVHQACLVAALTQGRDLLIRNPGRDVLAFREDLFGDRAPSDFWLLMRAYTFAAKNGFRLDACRRAGVHAQTARQVGPLHEQFLDLARKEGLSIESRPPADEALQKCILIGFSDRVARRLDQGTLRCQLVHNRRGTLARESVVQRETLFVAAEVREVEGAAKSVNTLLSLATAIHSDWLRELFPQEMEGGLRVFYDSGTKRVWAEEELRFRDLPLSVRRIEPPPAEAAARLLADEVLAGRLELKHWDHAVEQWILRLNLLARWCPELALPPITEANRRHLVEQLCHDAVSQKDIRDRDVKSVVRSWLSDAQREVVDREAPERLELPNGRQPRLTYVADGPPFIALRIQELYGVKATPRIARNRTSVLVHILAPNMRPVQITQDLEGFWREHYPRIKSELQRKYPKHEWR